VILAKVIGSVVSTIKHDCYSKRKIMLVRPIQPDGTERKGTLVAVDTVHAGIGDIVIVASEGRSASEILGFTCRIPLRSVIVGVVDRIKFTGVQHGDDEAV
jgi:microcompartment protein CcmK/EutM